MTIIGHSEKNNQFGEPLFWLTLYYKASLPKCKRTITSLSNVENALLLSHIVEIMFVQIWKIDLISGGVSIKCTLPVNGQLQFDACVFFILAGLGYKVTWCCVHFQSSRHCILCWPWSIK